MITMQLSKEPVVPSFKLGRGLLDQSRLLGLKQATIHGVQQLIESFDPKVFVLEQESYDRVQLHMVSEAGWNEALIDLCTALGVTKKPPVINLEEHPGIAGLRFEHRRGALSFRVTLVPPGYRWSTGYEVILDMFKVDEAAITQGTKAPVEKPAVEKETAPKEEAVKDTSEEGAEADESLEMTADDIVDMEGEGDSLEEPAEDEGVTDEEIDALNLDEE